MLQVPECVVESATKELKTTDGEQRRDEGGDEIELSETTPLLSPDARTEDEAVRKRRNSQPDEIRSGTVPVLNFGKIPQSVTCPHCKKDVKTEVKYNIVYKRTWKSILLIVFLFPCLILPFCRFETIKVPHHYCPKCKTLLGRYKKVTEESPF